MRGSFKQRKNVGESPFSLAHPQYKEKGNFGAFLPVNVLYRKRQRKAISILAEPQFEVWISTRLDVGGPLFPQSFPPFEEVFLFMGRKKSELGKPPRRIWKTLPGVGVWWLSS